MKRINLSGRVLKRGTIVEIISALFILLFLYTALSKSFGIDSTVNVLNKTPVLSGFAQEMAWAVVITEFIVAGLLFFPRTRNLGLYLSLALMTGFTVYIAYMMSFVPNLPCSCGGVISKMTWKQHLIFNIFFILLALMGILLGRKRVEQNDKENIPVVFT